MVPQIKYIHIIHILGYLFFFTVFFWHSVVEKYNLNPRRTAGVFLHNYFHILHFYTNYFLKCIGMGIGAFVM